MQDAARLARLTLTIEGARLFERSKSGVQANELGQCVVRHARMLEADLGRLRDQMNGVLRGFSDRDIADLAHYFAQLR